MSPPKFTINEDKEYYNGRGRALTTSYDPFFSSSYDLSPAAVDIARPSFPSTSSYPTSQFDFETLPLSPGFTNSCSKNFVSPVSTAFNQAQVNSSSPRFPLFGETSEYAPNHKSENSAPDLTITPSLAQKIPHFQEYFKAGQRTSPATSDLSTSSIRFSPYDSI